MRLTKRLGWRWGLAGAVAPQVRTGRPPQVRAAYERLRTAGITRWRASRLFAAAYEAEVASMLLEERVYSHEAYVQTLAALPAPPGRSLRDVPRSRRVRAG